MKELSLETRRFLFLAMVTEPLDKKDFMRIYRALTYYPGKSTSDRAISVMQGNYVYQDAAKLKPMRGSYGKRK